VSSTRQSLRTIELILFETAIGNLMSSASGPRATPPFDRHDRTSPSLNDAVDALLRFGALMLRAGNTAARTREWIEVIARKMGFDAVSIAVSMDNISASARRSGEWGSTMREIGAPGVNASRIAELEQLAKALGPGSAPGEIAAKLEDIEATKPLYSSAQIAAAVGVASGGFAFLNGAATVEMAAAAIGGGIGQWVRSWMAHRGLNQYAAAALSAIVASGVYVLAAALAHHAGFEFAHYPGGFIASVLFLIPGFPLIAALFDLLQFQTVAAVTRLAYGVMILLAIAVGLSLVIAIAGIDLSRQPPLELAYPLKLVLRAIASFVAACAFAMLFNTSPRTVLAVGLLALGANSLRLVLVDMGMMLAPAAFLAAVVIGLVALLVEQRFNVPRMATVVAPIVIMMPGIYAYEMIVLFNRGPMLDALEASAVCGFVIGALAMGLATARFFSSR
jgi:uncharacterized membrane protein YjjP (DUF1212 family)